MFYAYLIQSGEGCDYTIGCGTKLVALPLATSVESAEAQIVERYESYFGDYPEQQLSEVVIFETTNIRHVDVAEHKAKRRAEKKAADALARAEKERAMYEQLKAKYGDK